MDVAAVSHFGDGSGSGLDGQDRGCHAAEMPQFRWSVASGSARPLPRRVLVVVGAFVGGSLLVACAGTGPPPAATAASGLPGSARAAQAGAASLSPEELEDLTGHAARTGQSAEEVVSAYGWHASFSRLASQLQSSYPAEFAGARITDSPGRKAFVAFKGEAPAEARAAIGAYQHAAVDVVTSRGYSLRELDEVMVVAQRSVRAHNDLVKATSAQLDIADGRVIIDVVPADPADLLPPRSDALVKALRDRLPADISERVDIRLVRPRPTQE
jgi:hypothetical protein